MPTFTPNYNLPYFASADAPLGNAQGQQQMQAVDTNIKKSIVETVGRYVARASSSTVSVKGPTVVTTATTSSFTTLPGHLYRIDYRFTWAYNASSTGGQLGLGYIRESGVTLTDADGQLIAAPPTTVGGSPVSTGRGHFSDVAYWRPNAGSHILTAAVSEYSGSATLVFCQGKLSVMDMGLGS